MAKHYRSCNICEAMCGLIVHHESGEVTRIEADPADPLSRGHICPKAVALQDFRTDPDRVTTPLARRGAEWDEIGWDEAIDRAAHGIRAVQDAHGADGMGLYLGNPNAHKFGNLLTIPRLMKAIGSANRYSSATADQIPHHVAAIHMLGHPMLMPIPDVERTDLMVIIGGNPVVSNGSMMTAPDFPNRMKEIQARGGRVVTIDPRRTETAERADEHIFISPETDAWALMALIREVFELGPRIGHLAALTDGVEALREAAAPFTAEKAAARTGIDPARLRALARELAETKRAVVYSRMGASTQSFGGLCQWATNALNILTGHFDAPGGAMLTTPAFDYVGMTSRKGRPARSYPEKRSRVSGQPLYNGEFPVSVMAEEMETPGPGQIRGLMTIAGNPVLTAPNGRRIEAALKALDFMVSVDIHINDTTRHADLILPGTVALEEPVYDMVFHSFAVRNTAGYADALFDRPPGVIPEWEVFARLAAALTGANDLGPAPEALLPGILANGYHAEAASFEVLRAKDGAVDLGPLVPSLSGRLETPDGRLNLAPEVFLADLPRLLAQPAREGLALIGRRQVRSHNSWTQNAPRLVKGRNRCTLEINPEDAARLNVTDGATVRVASATGAVEAPAEVTAAMAPGVVSLPQGWGQRRGRLSAATQTETVSINDLTDDARIDPVTGNAAFNGLPVTVTPIGPRA